MSVATATRRAGADRACKRRTARKTTNNNSNSNGSGRKDDVAVLPECERQRSSLTASDHVVHKRSLDRGAISVRPRQRRRISSGDTTYRQSSFAVGLISLPPEILFEIGTWLRAADLGRLSATCTTLARAVDDERLWRVAFWRTYGRALYGDAAAGVITRHIAAVRAIMPASGPSAPPMPFLYMEAAGRGWRWLCATHATQASSPPQCDNAVPNVNAVPVTKAARYDIAPGALHSRRQRFAYGVEIKRDSAGAIVEWIEAIWDREAVPARPTTVLSHGNSGRWFAMDAAAAAAALDASESPPPDTIHRGRVVACAKGTTYEGACRRGVAHGVGIVTDADGRQWEAVSYDGLTLSTTWRPYDQSVESLAVRRVVEHCTPRPTDPAAAWAQYQQQQQQQQEGVRPTGRTRAPVALTVRYTNGDQLHLFHAAHTNSIAFWCSPDCVDPRFAGRRIECRTWAHTLDVGALAVWPLDDPADPESDARLFMDYVHAGHCGWTDAAQAHACQMAGLGSGVLFAARSALSPLPYGIVQSDATQMAVARRFFDTYG